MDKQDQLTDDIQPLERVIIYDPESGEILGSHIFGASGKLSNVARRRFESVLQRDLAEREKHRNGKLGLHRSEEANRLISLHHRVDLKTGRLVELPGPLSVKT